MGRPKDSKKGLVHPTASSTVTSSTASSSKTSAPLKIKLSKLGSSSKEKQKQHLAHTGTKKRPIILGKIPEDDDIEEKDVPVEEQFILRLMVPEEVKQRFREKVKSGKLTDDIGIIFKDPRRAIFTFENQKYRARLVDLPCIIEAQKTFNKIQYYKVADICQMLIVESQISSQEDEQLFTENSKSSNVDEFEWYDGLTPPLKNVRKKRFRKRISAKEAGNSNVLVVYPYQILKELKSVLKGDSGPLKIEDIEKEVEKLLHEDSLAEEVKLVWEDALDSETATPAAYLGSKIPEEEDQEEVEVQGEEDDYDAELEDDTMILGEDMPDEDQMYTTPKEYNDDLQKDVDEDPELTQIFSKREELTAEISRLEQDINNLETHFATAINPLIQGRLTSKIASAKEDISQKQQEIETCDKRVSEIHDRMKAQVAELKRMTKGKERESEEDSD
ncbi:13825_t:CDS:2 [Funneliformis geosporum]|uniref:15457_t:CDS:1 n=1 Tax=Funneliformis geosporum TaxID=1117311 RepID=A0A9W4SBW1_9GLOM|nr:15457_t:CDS:2 [Funneliformis geosporum]CAI2178282.1 13825_t:CDS:2 [Funneliformis geosporum]